MTDSQQSSMGSRRLRHVVIGVAGLVLDMHRPALQLDTVELAAVSSTHAQRGRQRAQELGCDFYTDYRQMLAETRPDVAVLLTSPAHHAPIALDCLQAGCHVLVEKAMARHVAEADEMIGAAARAGRLLAVNYQQRFRPEVRSAYALIRDGGLGAIQHVNLSASWPRTTAYYRSASWRATWAGEGGGVSVSQAPHDLDILCHLLGIPQQVVAWTRTTLHDIETEDTIHAMLEWPEGALGTLHISTAEAHTAGQLEIAGTGGCLQLTPGQVTYARHEGDLRELLLKSPEMFPEAPLCPAEINVAEGAGDHVAVYRNLHDAILNDAPLLIGGEEGRMSLELANALIYSSHLRSEVRLPLDREAYSALFEQLCAGAGPRKVYGALASESESSAR